MTNIYTQSSTQALQIYLKEIQNGNEVRVSRKTNCIYKANWADKLILKIDKKFFYGNQASIWRNEAKIFIINKFLDECALVEPEMKNFENSFSARESLLSKWATSEFDKKPASDIKNEFLASTNRDPKNYGNIKKILDNDINPNEYFFKKAFEKSNGFESAVDFSKKANSLKEKTGLPENYIFHLIYNAQLLQKKHNFSIDECINIIKFADQLVTKNKMNESEALSFAIDLKEPINSVNLNFDGISSVARSLFRGDNISKKTEISAALAYCQLKKSGKNHQQAMSIVEKRINNLKHIALQLPRGCKAECVHQGAHIRGKFTLTPDEITSCHKKLNLLKPDKALKRETGLTEKFGSMSAQFGKDIRRMNYQFLENGKTALGVRSLIPNDEKMNIGTTDQEKESWAKNFIEYAGGETAANLLTTFISQSMFGDIRQRTASSNSENLSVQFSGESNTDNFVFVVDQIEVDKVRKTVVRATQLINATKLISANLNENAVHLSDPAVEFNLISAIGSDQRAKPTAFGAKYECELEFDTAKLQQKVVDFKINRIVAEFDLVLDQDYVDSFFESLTTL